MTHPIVANDPRLRAIERRIQELKNSDSMHIERNREQRERAEQLKLEHRVLADQAAESGDPAPPQPDFGVEDIGPALRRNHEELQKLRAERRQMLAQMATEYGPALLQREREIQDEARRTLVRDWDPIIDEYESLRATTFEVATAFDSAGPGTVETRARSSLKNLIRRELIADIDVFSIIRTSDEPHSLIGLDRMPVTEDRQKHPGKEPPEDLMHPNRARALRLDSIGSTEL